MIDDLHVSRGTGRTSDEETHGDRELHLSSSICSPFNKRVKSGLV